MPLRPSPHFFLAALLPFFCHENAVAQSFVNYESGPVAPLRISADGTRLFVADTLGGRLNVFDLRDPSQPFLLAEIPVGLEPVSVMPRTRDEVWVVNQLSDSVSIVDVATMRVIDTLRVVDEPSDVVFAGGKAFVTAATVDTVFVFDAVTRASLGSVALFGKDPRALAKSPDGSRVYAVVQRSGNGTTILPDVHAPPPPPPLLTTLPPAPQQGLIVRADDPTWASRIPYTLPDHDVAQIDVATLTVTRYFDRVGTTNTGIAVHPTTGELWVANLDARNLVRFEPNLRGHAIDSRLSRITTGVTPVVTAFDLNVGMNYATLPNPAGLASALAEPFGVAIDAIAGRVYVAAHGTDRIGVLDLAGNVTARIEVGVTPGATVNTRQKRGPRALALHPTQSRLYVLNRLSDTLSVVDTAALTVLSERPIATVDPMPQAMREGRKFLYDAKLSGNGTMSCAACHIDGDVDGLAWDLGDPSGAMQPAPVLPGSVFTPLLVPFHPMKGPLTTQTLRGLEGTGPLHWRGDRADFQAFNGAFDALLGGAPLATADMDDCAAFALTLAHPPNPNQALDRQLRTAPAHDNESAGAAMFRAPLPVPGIVSCVACHAEPTGTNGLVINAQTIAEPQQMKVAQLRTLYRKVGFGNAPGPQKSGFGFRRDGSTDTLARFLTDPLFTPWPTSLKDDLATFLMVFDTGTAPAVGRDVLLSAATAGVAAVAGELALLVARAQAGDLDLTAHGVVDGQRVGLLLDAGTGLFIVDRVGAGSWSVGQLRLLARVGRAELAFVAVTPGTGKRRSLDRDGDARRDGDEAAVAYGMASSGCAGACLLRANSEPRDGNAAFGLVVDRAPATSLGVLAMGVGAPPPPFAVLGVQLLVAPMTTLTLVSDPFGAAIVPLPIPGGAAAVGATLHAQAIWLDPCGSQGLSSSAGLALTVVR